MFSVSWVAVVPGGCSVAVGCFSVTVFTIPSSVLHAAGVPLFLVMVGPVNNTPDVYHTC